MKKIKRPVMTPEDEKKAEDAIVSCAVWCSAYGSAFVSEAERRLADDQMKGEPPMQLGECATENKERIAAVAEKVANAAVEGMDMDLNFLRGESSDDGK